MNINESNRNMGISMVRFIAMIFIITCHFMQYFNFELAWWFNVGVQMFLCISGYLYSNKKIETVAFYKKTFRKILVPFFIVAIVFYPIIVIINNLGIKHFIKGLLLNSTLPGGGHLWFIPTILFCYFITPIISAFYDNCKKAKSIVFTYLGMLIVIFLSLKFIIAFFNPAWISCYVTGFFLGRIFIYGEKRLIKVTSITLLGLAFVANFIQIIFDYVMKIKFTGYGVFCNYAHLLLGVAFSLILSKVFENIKYNQILRFSDNYSYEIYLVHQFFILGPLSLMKLTNYTLLNVIIIIICVLTSGIIVNRTAKVANILFDKAINMLHRKKENKSL